VESPEAFTQGIAKGTESLVRNSVYALANTASQLMSFVNKGLASVSLDDSYKRSRERAILNTPRTFSEGLAEGVKGFSQGIYYGITGIVRQPIEGAKQEGVGGFFKGVGKGLIGVAVRPVAGIVDLAHKPTQTLRNTVMIGEKRYDRVRPPRYFSSDRVLRPYAPDIAEYQQLLYTTLNAKENEIFLTAIRVTEGLIVYLTNQHVFFLTEVKKRDRSKINKEWEIKLSDIEKITPVDAGIELALKAKKVLFGSSIKKKIIPAHPSLRDTIIQALKTAQRVVT